MSQATACIRKIDEVICIKVQHWNTMLCYYIVHFKTTVKAKDTFHSRASYSIFIEFHGSHTLFTSTPYLVVRLVRGGPLG